jgi:hypothetical protein
MARGLLLIATMKTHSIGSISKMGAVIALFGLSTACGGATTYDAGGSAGQGGAAGQGGSGGGGPTTSDAGMECPPPGDANPGAMLGLSSDSPMNVEGAVSRAFADRLEVMTSTGTLTLSWVGPPLDAAFAANEGIDALARRSVRLPLASIFARVVLFCRGGPRSQLLLRLARGDVRRDGHPNRPGHDRSRRSLVDHQRGVELSHRWERRVRVGGASFPSRARHRAGGGWWDLTMTVDRFAAAKSSTRYPGGS